MATVARVVSWLKGGLGSKNKKPSRGVGYISPPILEDTRPRVEDVTDGDPYGGLDTSSSSSHESGGTQYAEPAKPEAMVIQLGNPPERRPRPESDAFFSFEFEGGLAPPDSGSATPPSTSPTSVSFPNSSAASVNSTLSADTAFPRSPLRRSAADPHGVNARVSLRFSKRISILPPAALDLLKESGEAVPSIPAHFLVRQGGYAKALHPYAIRGLRDYEDALDEWTDWVARLQEEEDDGKKHNRGFVDVVPRLSVAWPQAFENDA